MDDSEAADVRRSAQAHYSRGQEIWDKKDLWNQYKRTQIDAFVTRRCQGVITTARSTLNAGSGGDAYSWLPANAVNSDLFIEQAKKLPRAVVSDVCSLPFPSGAFDLSICVGSVLNYASLLEAVTELARTLKVGGHLIVHFESSNSFEQWLTPNWNKAVARITTINGGQKDQIWVYSPKFVAHVLRSQKLKILDRRSFHIASAMASRLGLSQKYAAKFSVVDSLMGALGAAADDQIILAEKTA